MTDAVRALHVRKVEALRDQVRAAYQQNGGRGKWGMSRDQYADFCRRLTVAPKTPQAGGEATPPGKKGPPVVPGHDGKRRLKGRTGRLSPPTT